MRSDGRPSGELAQSQARLYAEEPETYDRLVSAGDPEHRLDASLEEVCPLRGRRVLDVGAGTGRMTRSLRRLGARTWSLDRETAMLDLARRHPREPAVGLAVADLRALPLPTACVDAALAGWVLGHFPFWSSGDWRRDVEGALAEMARVIRPGGHQVILESLGVGRRRPEAPGAELAAYHSLLDERGFRRRTIATDYVFGSLAEARDLIETFFGRRVAARVRGPRVPETTGLWWHERVGARSGGPATE